MARKITLIDALGQTRFQIKYEILIAARTRELDSYRKVMAKQPVNTPEQARIV